MKFSLNSSPLILASSSSQSNTSSSGSEPSPGRHVISMSCFDPCSLSHYAEEVIKNKRIIIYKSMSKIEELKVIEKVR